MISVKKFSISNIFIIISIIFTIIWYFNDSFIFEWSINNFYLEKWNYLHFIIQFFTGNFIHAWIMHIFMNAVFIYYFWNILEIMLWKTKFLIFFISFAIFNWIILSYLQPNAYTIWISWFAMAIITYYTLELKALKNPDYKWWITAIIINLAVWFHPWISFYWHLNWVIFWIIFYYLTNDFFKRQMIWLFNFITFSKKESIWTFSVKKD